jgi:hypothetical protein
MYHAAQATPAPEREYGWLRIGGNRIKNGIMVEVACPKEIVSTFE